jgi:HSP20 family protein
MANLTLRRNEGQNAPARQTSRGSAMGWDPFRLMDSLLGWDPFQEMAPALRQFGGTAQAFIPAFEVHETNDGYVFKADLPGVKENDIDISLTGTQLTISGKREAETQGDVSNYFTYERSYGSFSRTFTLPQGADVENVKADLKDGVLTLLVPKRPEMQPRKISLGQGGAASNPNTLESGKKANA